MDRRTFIATSALGAMSLSACGGGGGSDAPTPSPTPSPAPSPTPSPTPNPTPNPTPTTRFVTGWTQMPLEDYENIPGANEGNFAYTEQSDLDLSNAEMLSQMGWPTLLPQPDPVGQGRQPSCTAWAVGFAAATATMRYAGLSLPMPISPADLFAKTHRRTGDVCSNGSLISYTMDTLVQEGVATLTEAPYSDLQCAVPSSLSTFRLDGYSRVAASDGRAIRGSIQMLQPVSFGMLVDEHFQNLSPGNSVYVPSGTGSGHATTVIGYDNRTQRYKIMNSWGRNWGEGGMYWMSYSDFARFATDVCIPYLRRESENQLLAKSTSNQSSPVIAQFMNARPFANGSPGGYGVGAEMGWSDPLDVRAASLSVLDEKQKVLFNQDFSVRQVARGIRFGIHVSDASSIYTYVKSTVSGFDRFGSPIALATITKPYRR
jgi:hypothetical protein